MNIGALLAGVSKASGTGYEALKNKRLLDEEKERWKQQFGLQMSKEEREKSETEEKKLKLGAQIYARAENPNAQREYEEYLAKTGIYPGSEEYMRGMATFSLLYEADRQHDEATKREVAKKSTEQILLEQDVQLKGAQTETERAQKDYYGALTGESKARTAGRGQGQDLKLPNQVWQFEDFTKPVYETDPQGNTVKDIDGKPIERGRRLTDIGVISLANPQMALQMLMQNKMGQRQPQRLQGNIQVEGMNQNPLLSPETGQQLGIPQVGQFEEEDKMKMLMKLLQSLGVTKQSPTGFTTPPETAEQQMMEQMGKFRRF
uniref:Uncharacterized protein n=1 Tax=viral metagenome TaxID=1070528 RepID=A0A6H1ZGY1_9ZZZZ